MFKRTGGPPPMFWLHARVDDVDERAKQTEALGGKVMNGPMDVPGGGRIAQIADPQGAVFALHQTAKA
jgi:predicted enzyme related to lactoylglutathione lyase